MTLVELLIYLFTLLSTGQSICDVGQPLDWVPFATEHQEMMAVAEYWASDPNFEVYSSSAGYVLFVYARPLADTIAAHEYAAHGQCARLLDVQEIKEEPRGSPHDPTPA